MKNFLTVLMMVFISLSSIGQNTIYQTTDFTDGWTSTLMAPLNATNGDDVDLTSNGAIVTISTMMSNTSIYLEKELIGLESFAGLSDYTINMNFDSNTSGLVVKTYLSTDGGSNYNLMSHTSLSPGVTSYTEDETVSGGSIGDNITFKIEIDSYGSSYTLEDIEIIDNDAITTGIEDNVGVDENELKVYSSNKSVYLSSEITQDYIVNIYNIGGQLMKTQNVYLTNSTTEINLYDFNSGFYIVTLSNGTSMKSEKVYIK